MLPLDEIIADARTQVRAAIDEAVVDEYVEQLDAGVVFPPVTVFRSEAGTYLGDGFHRVAVHRRAGLPEIAADIRTGNRADALWFALGANRAHGHRLTAALEAWRQEARGRTGAGGLARKKPSPNRGADRMLPTVREQDPAGHNQL